MDNLLVRNRRWAGWAGCLALLMSGCRDNGRGEVHGLVTLDGQPIAVGAILFLPAEGTKGPTAGASIADGRFEVPAAKGPVPGPHRVEIRAIRKTGKRVPAQSPAPAGMIVDETVEMVPERYNKNSTLRFEVTKGSNTANFELVTGDRDHGKHCEKRIDQ